MNWKPQYAYAYPDDNDPEVKQVKRLAAKCGRAYRQAEKFEQHKAKLREFMQTLDKERLRYWAGVVMLDPRFCGATGTGAYWSVASEQVNEVAKELLRERDCEFRTEAVAQFKDRGEPLKASELKSVQEQIDEVAKPSPLSPESPLSQSLPKPAPSQKRSYPLLPDTPSIRSVE